MQTALINTVTIPKLIFSEPRFNLPGNASTDNNKESIFAVQFAQVYLSKFTSIHSKTSKKHISLAREIPVNGFGIADIVAIATNTDPLVNSKPTIRAFEIKLDNWRRAMVQANRYSFFAHASIMVLPTNKCHLAIAYMKTLRKINVGLWGFNPETNTITTYYTPSPKIPKSTKYMLKAIELVSKASIALPAC